MLLGMIQIDWEEYKLFKKEFQNPKNLDNFGVLLYFLKGYYNVRNVVEMYEILAFDELSKMMLEKRELVSSDDLEDFVNKMMRQ